MLDAKTSAERTELGRKALDTARRAVAANPNNAQAYLSLAIVYGRIALTLPSTDKDDDDAKQRARALLSKSS